MKLSTKRDIIHYLEDDFAKLVRRYDKSKDSTEKQEINAILTHSVEVLAKIKKVSYNEEMSHLWIKYNLFR